MQKYQNKELCKLRKYYFQADNLSAAVEEEALISGNRV